MKGEGFEARKNAAKGGWNGLDTEGRSELQDLGLDGLRSTGVGGGLAVRVSRGGGSDGSGGDGGVVLHKIEAMTRQPNGADQYKDQRELRRKGCK
jgi:hypothetical protein